MPTRSLGPDAPTVSALGLGAMPLSLRERPAEADAIRVIHAALDAGVTLIDTADCYCIDNSEVGHNERLIAKALRTWSGRRDSLIVATKGGSTKLDATRWQADGRPEHLRSACEQSLRSLGVDRIDLYQLHGPDPRVPFEDSVGALAELSAAGKVRWVGLSNVTVTQIKSACRIVNVQSVQNLLNPFFRGSARTRMPLFRRSVLDHCSRKGLGFLAFSPVGGFLHKQIRGHPVVSQIAARHGVSPYRVVLAWVMAQSPNVIAIPGARSVEHTLDSIAAADLELPREDLAAIDRAEFHAGT